VASFRHLNMLNRQALLVGSFKFGTVLTQCDMGPRLYLKDKNVLKGPWNSFRHITSTSFIPSLDSHCCQP
jgi:hypothetical protein